MGACAILRNEDTVSVCLSQSVEIPSFAQELRRLFVFLTYIDDSDTRAKVKKWQVLTAVIIPDSLFYSVELMASVVIERLMPEEELEKFEEFHACELYGGYGVFEKIDQAKRFEAIEAMLQTVHSFSLPIVYGAVNLDALKKQVYFVSKPPGHSF
jgi:hypothetical protein